MKLKRVIVPQVFKNNNNLKRKRNLSHKQDRWHFKGVSSKKSSGNSIGTSLILNWIIFHQSLRVKENIGDGRSREILGD